MPAFVAAGGAPFTFAKKDRKIVTSLMSPPAEALESPSAMKPWARLALEAAMRATAKKTRVPKKP